jgi:hypothetical protein
MGHTINLTERAFPKTITEFLGELPLENHKVTALATARSHLLALERCFPNSRVCSHLAMAMACGSVCGEGYIVDGGCFKD